MLIQEFGYSVPPGREEDHQAWVLANEDSLRAAMPEGTELIGVFAMVYSSEKNAGFYRIIKLENYASLDRFSEAMKNADADFGRLIREHSGFMDLSWDAPTSNGLHKAVVDAAVFDPSQ